MDSNNFHVTKEFIDNCAGDFDIRYALFCNGKDIYAGYYDPEHYLTIAKKDASGVWQFKKLPEKVSWDSHKYITMSIDKEGYIHVCANMHSNPLVYYRSERPRDINAFKKLSMTGDKEESVTYPEFLETDDSLYFHYRDGKSGNGETYINKYDLSTHKWSRITESPLFDGQGESNAYFKGPFRGKDGKFHIVWCWRDTPDCLSNHGLFYARSSDLISWANAADIAKSGPITPDDKDFLVDNIKAGEGLINGGFAVGVAKERGYPYVTYHKYDENGNTNIYLACFKNGEWGSVRLTDWKWRWDFSGKGSIPFLLDITSLYIDNQGNINIIFSRFCRAGFFSKKRMRDFKLIYNPDTNEVEEKEYKALPDAISSPSKSKKLVHIIPFPDLFIQNNLNKGAKFLRYETLFPNRDKRKNSKKQKGELWLVSLSTSKSD